ncbi:protein maelstrom homolog [Bradysia coprophila]|uniref:protein maelstrom homolog n=1 Tax=Bradysia coprophila TaxID=38358 RepID=UPI00187DC18A|nr:protein maelstrom homolog [Bradysia coprophila]
MSAQKRRSFKKKLEKYTSQRIALSVIDQKQKELDEECNTMIRTIKRTVAEAFVANTIASEEFYLISGNYFTKIEQEYLPAEIAMVKFSFENGITNKYHTYVAPENIQMGYQADAIEHSTNTHRLAVPPNATGERNYQRILNEMKRFMGEPTPILFTFEENIAMIKSFIRLFANSGNNDDIKVYPLHQLFYEIKVMTAKNSAMERPSFGSINIAKEHLRRYDCVLTAGTACAYHELDCGKHCPLSHVQHWAYILFHHICGDLNIKLISGEHSPCEGQSSRSAIASNVVTGLTARVDRVLSVQNDKDIPTLASRINRKRPGGALKSPKISTFDST